MYKAFNATESFDLMAIFSYFCNVITYDILFNQIIYIMEWKNHYESHKCTADEAVDAIKDNYRLVYGHAAATPQTFNKALANQKDRFTNVSIYHMLTTGTPWHISPEMKGHLQPVSSFICKTSLKGMDEGLIDFIPSYFRQVPLLFQPGQYPVDVAVVQLSTPNEEGFCTFGVSCDYTKPAADCAKIVIAEINDQMPRVGGDNLIHVSELDYIIETSYALAETATAISTDIETTIAEYCASLIGDGATLQIGIGAIPNAVLSFLKDRKDLGVHTELFTEGIIDLVNEGVITGSRKTIHPNKIIATFIMGTKRMYDFVDKNLMLELHPVNYVNNPIVIGQNDQMVSINSCIEVDLMGQTASESIGLRQYSGTGGQVDYVQGARLSKGGKSIIAIPSTAAGGKISRIVPFLLKGTAVTTSRNDIDYIITEYGIAHLRGQTLRQRAKLLIDVAHPKFREELTIEFDKRFK